MTPSSELLHREAQAGRARASLVSAGLNPHAGSDVKRVLRGYLWLFVLLWPPRVLDRDVCGNMVLD